MRFFSKQQINQLFSINHKQIAFIFTSIQVLFFAGFHLVFIGFDTPTIKYLVFYIATIVISYYVFSYLIKFLIFKPIYKAYIILRYLHLKVPYSKFLPREDPSSFEDFNLKILSDQIQNYVAQKEDEIKILQHLQTYHKDLIANISHELKTPIFSAQGYVSTVLDNQNIDKKTQYDFLKKAVKSLDFLDLLVRDLITLSKLESGKLTVQKEIFDIQAIILEIFEDLQKKTSKKQITLRIKDFSENGIYVFADKEKIRQVLLNLVYNAISYGKQEGFVEVHWIDWQDKLHILVEDNGIGISEDNLDRIFQRFYRVDKSRSKNQGGTGLGLSIVKYILELHDSKVLVKSELNKGSQFSFSLDRDS